MAFITHIYGRDRMHSTCYMTRIKLTPKTRWGQLYLHIFHRADDDRDAHDHPYDFWTFPLTSYREKVYRNPWSTISPAIFESNVVKAFKWHFRPAEYAHVMHGGKNGKAITLVWRKQTRRAWGFWMYDGQYDEYFWVPKKDYLRS